MPRTIKKYANRRLYDTQASQHVTLEGIRALVADGEDIVVIDDTTNEDITRNILLQVVSDQEQSGRPILSTEMLKYLIRFYGNPMQDFLTQYLEQSVETFLGQQASLQEKFQETLSNAQLAGIQNLATQNMEAWNKLQSSFLESLDPNKKKDS